MPNEEKRRAGLEKNYGPNWRDIFKEAAQKPRPNGGKGGFAYLKKHDPERLKQIIKERDAKKHQAKSQPTQEES